MKVERKIFKGIEYVQVAELPLVQREKLLQTINRDLFIKILMNDEVVSECLQFKDYSSWFDNVYKAKVLAVSEAEESIKVTASLALDKI